MLGIKRLYLFVLRSFLPLFLMTFFICLFIVLMQFLWRYIDDLVGKGLGIDVLGELFFYAALTMIPMALPLAILLASLMTFGNLGEKFELTAMKASGISLLRVMKPLIWLMVIISVAAFFFQNDVLPVAQTKMWTLLFSVRQKSPELEIPEGVFYDQIPGYNLFVEGKDRESGTLYGVMIYDMSQGFDNARVILADSGHLASTADNSALFLQLWDGEMFENLSSQGVAGNVRNVPYRRESFTKKEILVPFDANFNRMDEEGMRKQYVGKNITELRATIDSVNRRVDSLGGVYGREILNQPVVGLRHSDAVVSAGAGGAPSHPQPVSPSPLPKVSMARPLDIDSVFRGSSSASAPQYITIALNRAKRNRQDYEFKSFSMADDRKSIRRHDIELQKKFTLSFACIIFFFIGAPLGAIIRKGGLGTPLVVSVLLFIFYYIIDNTGYKMARDGKIAVWEGIWVSSAVLLPMGMFFTYKAMNDSDVLNVDAYIKFFGKLLGRHETRAIEMKTVIMDEVDADEARRRLESLVASARGFIEAGRRNLTFRNYLRGGIGGERFARVADEVETTVEYLSNSRDKLVINKIMDYPVLRHLWIYRPLPRRWMSAVALMLAPLSFSLYMVARRYNRSLLAEMKTIVTVSNELLGIMDNDIMDNE